MVDAARVDDVKSPLRAGESPNLGLNPGIIPHIWLLIGMSPSPFRGLSNFPFGIRRGCPGRHQAGHSPHISGLGASRLKRCTAGHMTIIFQVLGDSDRVPYTRLCRWSELFYPGTFGYFYYAVDNACEFIHGSGQWIKADRIFYGLVQWSSGQRHRSSRF